MKRENLKKDQTLLCLSCCRFPQAGLPSATLKLQQQRATPQTMAERKRESEDGYKRGREEEAVLRRREQSRPAGDDVIGSAMLVKESGEGTEQCRTRATLAGKRGSRREKISVAVRSPSLGLSRLRPHTHTHTHARACTYTRRHSQHTYSIFISLPPLPSLPPPQSAD